MHVEESCRSFKTIQCFNQDFNQILALAGSTEFSVALWYLYHFFLLQLCFHFIEARPRIWLVVHLPFLPRKEVIQPHLPIRLPCYDFTPIIDPTFGGGFLRSPTDFGCCQLSWCDGRCVQGPGTYSPRHADPRLLATPTSCGRVAAHNPNWDGFFEIRLSSQTRFSL